MFVNLWTKKKKNRKDKMYCIGFEGDQWLVRFIIEMPVWLATKEELGRFAGLRLP